MRPVAGVRPEPGRSVAHIGRVPAKGAGGRKFDSFHSDH